MDDLAKQIESDELSTKWLINGYNRLFRNHKYDVTSIIRDLRSRGFSDRWIGGLSKATHYLTGVSLG